jgi:hypothetical protein
VSDRLHPLLLLLTLCDLGFVQATGAVSNELLAPLWLLSFASVRLRRLQQYFAYRAAWNVGVVVVFSLLVHHATTTGLLHMLEDGLVLAVLCQVHLLNNIGARQRPDLTFFNSFLIAFVTSFFVPDFWWSLLFAAHTLVLVPALQLYVLTGRGRAVEAEVAWTVLRDSLPRAVAVAALTGAVFVLWPRDFERQGWLREQIAFHQPLQGGLTERIELERNQPSYLSDRLALRVEPSDKNCSAVPTHWRANAFATFDGRAWHLQDEALLDDDESSDAPWRRTPAGAWQRRGRGAVHTELFVRHYARGNGRIAAPLNTITLLPGGPAGVVLEPEGHGGFSVVAAADASRGPLTYTLGLAQPAPGAGVNPRWKATFTALPDGGVPELARDLARRLRARAPEDADDLTFAESASRWLQENRRYELPGGPGFAGNLVEFLMGSAPGHCEYFATALALLLRSEGVPCRVVGGYLVHERDETGDAMVARARDAHAWVEVLAPDGSWHTFDATPPADVGRAGAGDGFWHEVTTWLRSAWAAVTDFDDAERARWLTAALTLPLRRPLPCAAVLGAFLGLWWLRSRRRPRPPTVASLERALRAAKLELRRGETPRELLARAEAAALAPGAKEAIRAATRDHERARYGR